MKRSVRMLLIAIACSGAIPAAGFGQERVRLTLPSGTITGVVTRMSPQELELNLDGGGSRVMFRHEVLQLERSTVHDYAFPGYLLGSWLGYLGGFTAAEVLHRIRPDGDWWLATPAGLILGGVAGFVIGSKKREVWKIVPNWAVAERTTGLAAEPQATRGVGLAAKFRF